MLLARLLRPTGGILQIGEHNLAELPEAVTGRRMAYVGAGPYIFSASLRGNLFFGLKHRPERARELDEEEQKALQQFIIDAEHAGNPTDDYLADWTAYADAGVDSPKALNDRALEVLALVDMEDDIYQMGLRSVGDPSAYPELTARILEARVALRERLDDPQISALVEVYDVERYNTNATVAENLLFGTPVDPAFAEDKLAENPYVQQVLDQAGLTQDLLKVGHDVAKTMVELFSGLAPGHEFFEQYSFISSDDLPEFQDLLSRAARSGLEALATEDKVRLLTLSFKLVPARHRLGLLDEDIQRRIVEARQQFAAGLPAELEHAIEFFDAERYNASGTIQDNILFGKLVYGQARSAARLGTLIAEVLDQLDIRRVVMEVGLDYQVGIAGSRLSAAQRQKLAIARAVLKRPDILLLNEATSALDASAQMRVMENLLEEFKGRGLIWALHRASLADHFDRVLVVRDGKVVEQGSFGDLIKQGTAFKELLDAE